MYRNLVEAIFAESRTVTSLEEPGKNDKDQLLYKSKSKYLAVTKIPIDTMIEGLETVGFNNLEHYRFRVTKNTMTGKHIILVEFLYQN